MTSRTELLHDTPPAPVLAAREIALIHGVNPALLTAVATTADAGFIAWTKLREIDSTILAMVTATKINEFSAHSRIIKATDTEDSGTADTNHSSEKYIDSVIGHIVDFAQHLRTLAETAVKARASIRHRERRISRRHYWHQSTWRTRKQPTAVWRHP